LLWLTHLLASMCEQECAALSRHRFLCGTPRQHPRLFLQQIRTQGLSKKPVGL
jgi:hypothetical protein